MKHSKKEEMMEQLVEMLSKLTSVDTETKSEADAVDVTDEPRYTMAEFRKMMLDSRDEIKETLVGIVLDEIFNQIDFSDYGDGDEVELSLDGNTICVDSVGIDDYRLRNDIEKALEVGIDVENLVEILFESLEVED